MKKESILGAFSQTARLAPRAQRQILDVYTTLALVSLCSMCGYYTACRFPFITSFGMILPLGLLGLVCAVLFMAPTQQNLSVRRLLVWTIGWISGVVIQPGIIQFMNSGEAHIVYAALGISVALFVSFGVAVMSSTQAQTVYAVGAVTFAMSALSWVSLLNYIYPTPVLSNMSLMVGLSGPCLSAVVHTSNMIERAAQNVDIDPVVSALGFFSDLVQMFVHLVALLSNDRQRKEEEERRNKRSGRRCYPKSKATSW
ncbi:hypothetical protein IWW49_005006 [Coemansia sp. RSA 1797]|nr:hypothetical protein IWW49_005006 [Coemansia sp. RSA 1797]